MPKYRMSASLVWDLEGDFNKNEIQQKSTEQLHLALDKISQEMNIKIRGNPKVSCSKLKVEKNENIPNKKTLKEFDFDEVFNNLSNSGVRKDFKINNVVYKVKMNSSRYFVFKENRNCVACGIKGTKLFLELPYDSEYPHFNLYAEQDDNLVLMTKDHILAKSCGGKDVRSNYQTMCSICNNIKGKDSLLLSDIKILRDINNKSKLEGKNTTEIHHLIDEHKTKLLEKIEETPIILNQNFQWNKILICAIIILLDLFVLYYHHWYIAVIALVMAILGFSAGNIR